MKTFDPEVSEVFGGGTDGVEDAVELACRVFIWFEWLLIGILHCSIGFTLVELLVAEDVIFIQ